MRKYLLPIQGLTYNNYTAPAAFQSICEKSGFLMPQSSVKNQPENDKKDIESHLAWMKFNLDALICIDVSHKGCVAEVALFDISISNIDCRYIDTFEKYRYRYGHF